MDAGLIIFLIIIFIGLIAVTIVAVMAFFTGLKADVNVLKEKRKLKKEKKSQIDERKYHDSLEQSLNENGIEVDFSDYYMYHDKNEKSNYISSNNKNENSIIGTIIFILIVLAALAWYPWFVSLDENNEAHCKNIFGFEFNCRK